MEWLEPLQPTMTSIKKNHSLFLLAVLLSAAALPVLAASDTWSGGSSASGNWSDTANWGGATVNSGDLLFFAGTTRLSNTNDLSGYSFSGITFNSGAGLFNLNGNAFDLTGGITNNSTSGQTINNNITLSAGNHTILLPASTANITNNGNFSEDGSGSASLTFSTPGSKTLVLNGTNSLTGGFTLLGTSTTQFGLVLGNTNALGTNWIDVTGGALALNAAAPGANPFIISNPDFTNARDIYFSGDNVLLTGLYVEGGGKQICIVPTTQTVTFNGGIYNIGGDVALKSGPGTLVLNGPTTGGFSTVSENGVSYSASLEMHYNSGVGTLVVGNPGALGSSSGYFVVDGGGGILMANTDLSGANALTANMVLYAATSATGLTIGGTNNITFDGNLYVSIGTGGAATRYLIVTNTAATVFAGGNDFLSDSSSGHAGTLSVNVAGTSGGIAISGSIADGGEPGGSLILTNAGMLILSGPNSYSGPTVINGGQLWVNAQGASQSSTFVVNTNGGLVFSNDTAFVLGGLSGAGNVSLTNNSGDPVTLTVGNNNASTVYSGMLSDGGTGANLTKTGSGTLTLSGTNNFTGLTTVSQGTLVISPNFAGQGDLTISEGTTLGVFTNTTTTSAQIGELQFGSSGSGSTTLAFSSLPAPTKAPITAATINTIDGAGSVNVVINSALNVGTYNLVNYTSFTGDGFGDFAAPTLPSGTSGYLTNNTAASVIQLVITSTALEVWTGAVSTNWDFSTYNWKFNNVATNYSDDSPVQFDDTASQPNVYLAASVQPFSILVTNNTMNYTFNSSGNNIYGVTTLSKSGPGSLTLLGLNDTFTGDVSINGGTVTLSSGTLGGGNVNLNNGSLVLSASVLGNSGNVTLNGGSLVISNSTTLTNNITDDSSIVSGSGSQSITGNIIGNGSLAQDGNGTLTLSGINTFSSGTAINDGTIILATSTTSLGNGNVTLGDGFSTNDATLTFGTEAQTMNNNITVVAGGTGTYTINGYTNGTGLAQNGSVTASNTVVVTGDIIFNGVVSGSGMIVANIGTNNESRFANGNNTWTGNLLLTNDSTFKTVTGSMNTNNVVYVDVGSTFDTFAQPLTIAGLNDGPNGGGSVVPSGVLLTLGGSGSYSFSGAITLGASLLMDGTGTQTLSGANTYTGSTVVSNGTLVVNGSISNGAVNVYGGTLAGTGTLYGPTTVFGGTLSPSVDAVIGTLTISNSLTLQAGGTLAVNINKTTATNDAIAGLSSIAYGGTLSVTNLSGMLTMTDAFKLFSAGSYSGAFATITPATPGAGLAWNTNTLTTDGTLRVATATALLTSMGFTAVPVISGTSLTISATNTGAGTVYLLTSTNVAAPLNTWTPIWTNVLSGSGSFTTNLSDAVTPALNQQFYLLSNTNN